MFFTVLTIEICYISCNFIKLYIAKHFAGVLTRKFEGHILEVKLIFFNTEFLNNYMKQITRPPLTPLYDLKVQIKVLKPALPVAIKQIKFRIESNIDVDSNITDNINKNTINVNCIKNFFNYNIQILILSFFSLNIALWIRL